MNKVAEHSDCIVVSVSRTELRIVNNSLNEVGHALRIPDSQFNQRLGAPKSEIRRLLDSVRNEAGTWRAQSDRKVHVNNDDGIELRLNAFELVLLREAMIEVTKGVEIEEWEYPIRMGATVKEGKQLLKEVEELIGSSAAQRA